MKKTLKLIGKVVVVLTVTVVGVVFILTILADELNPLPPEEYEEENLDLDLD